MMQTLPEFNGETGQDHLALDWLNNLKLMFELYLWPDGLRLQIACRSLKGAARDWYLSRMKTMNSWSLFESAFLNTFTSETSFTQKFTAMQKLIQEKNESAFTYFHNKVRLCQPLHLTFKDVKKQFLMGLWSKELAVH